MMGCCVSLFDLGCCKALEFCESKIYGCGFGSDVAEDLYKSVPKFGTP